MIYGSLNVWSPLQWNPSINSCRIYFLLLSYSIFPFHPFGVYLSLNVYFVVTKIKMIKSCRCAFLHSSSSVSSYLFVLFCMCVCFKCFFCMVIIFSQCLAMVCSGWKMFMGYEMMWTRVIMILWNTENEKSCE